MLTFFALAIAAATTVPTWSLHDCVAIAEKQQPQLRAAELGAEALGADLSAATGGLGPQLNVVGTAQRQTSPLGAASATPTAPFSIFNAGFQSNWTLWDGNRFYSWRELAQNRNAAEFSARSALFETRFGVANAYFQLSYAQQSAEIRRLVFERTELLALQAQALVEAGRQPPIDSVRANAALETARADMIQSENAVFDADNELLTVMGLPLTTPHSVSDVTQDRAYSFALTAYTRALMSQDPALQALQAQAAASRAALRGAQWSNLPSLSAAGAYGWRSGDLDTWAPNWSAGLTLNQPLFSSGTSFNRVKSRDYAVQRADALVEAATQRLSAQAESYVRAAESANRRSQALQAARKAAEANVALAGGRYRAGAGSIIEVVDAELLLANTALAEAAGIRDQRLARARALTAAGLPLE